MADMTQRRDSARRLGAFGAIFAGLALSMLALSMQTSSAEESAGTTVADRWETPDIAEQVSADDRVIGRVVGLRGRVYAQSPGQERRLLKENAPIFPGDRLVTSSGAQLGVLSGEYYTGLNEDTTLSYAKQGSGAPVVTLERGDVRLINAGEGDNAAIATPGMRARVAAADTSAYALEEKAWMVSMVCALEGQVQVSGGGRSMQVEEGGCALVKPAEGLFFGAGPAAPLPVVQSGGALPGVGAAGPGAGAGAGFADAAALAAAPAVVGAGAAGAGVGGAGAGAGGAGAGAAPQAFAAAATPPVSGNAASRFAGPGVGSPPGFAALNVRPGIDSPDDAGSIIQPCDQAASGCMATVNAINPVAFPPLNGVVPGIQP